MHEVIVNDFLNTTYRGDVMRSWYALRALQLNWKNCEHDNMKQSCNEDSSQIFVWAS